MGLWKNEVSFWRRKRHWRHEPCRQHFFWVSFCVAQPGVGRPLISEAENRQLRAQNRHHNVIVDSIKMAYTLETVD